MMKLGFPRLLGLVGALAWGLSSVPADPANGPTGNRIEGCVEGYDPTVDYFPEKARIRHATGFDIEYRKHYKILTVLTPWPNAKEPFRYVLLQCGTPRSAGRDGARVIEVPIQTIATLSATHLSHLQLLDELASLVAMSDPEWVYSPRIREHIASTEVKAIGRGTSLNIETVLDLAPDLVTAVGHDQPQLNAHPVLERAGVQVVINSEYVEGSALGRAEWLKFTAAFFNKEEMAERRFAEMEKRYASYAAMTQPIPTEQRPTVLGGALFRDTWHGPGGDSYIARLVHDAGGRYLWAEDSHRASIPLSFEVVFDRAADADYWFTGRLEWFTRAGMLAENERYGRFKAFQLGQVYNSNARVNHQGANDFWETAVVEPHLLLADFIKILHPHLLPEHRLRYYRRLE
ncbi:MAG: ABC transporter substrate-binding protein [Gammaproteobacteria bacterium]